MTRLVFKIQGMDCSEEVAVLQRAIGPVVGGTDHMSCDLLNGTMTVSLPEGAANPGPIMQAVRKTPAVDPSRAERFSCGPSKGSAYTRRREAGTGRIPSWVKRKNIRD